MYRMIFFFRKRMPYFFIYIIINITKTTLFVLIYTSNHRGMGRKINWNNQAKLNMIHHENKFSSNTTHCAIAAGWMLSCLPRKLKEKLHCERNPHLFHVKATFINLIHKNCHWLTPNSIEKPRPTSEGEWTFTKWSPSTCFQICCLCISAGPVHNCCQIV